jgi:hypothetical protein
MVLFSFGEKMIDLILLGCLETAGLASGVVPIERGGRLCATEQETYSR